VAKNGSVIFEVRAEGKNLKVVQRDVDAVASGVERTDTARKKAGKGQDAYNKREKALYQSGLSSAKGFSKMSQTIGGGSSGLVGAYATLAANVFAATAAFQVLKEAAQFENLVQGLEQVGASAGRNLTFASEKLREVSGYALSTEKAMRSMALGISSGFSTEQMEGLTEIARGASIALGRDMGDAMDRLTRGAAKLEPEILDELGIMVRLDDATEEYATSLGKTASQLTQFERRQAFLNAILEQGEAKFGQLADSVDPNPYDKLSASLSNLQKTVVSAFNVVLGPIINLMSESQAALAAGVTLFASTIVRTMIPSLNNLSQGMANNAKRGADLAKTQAQNLDVSTKLPKAYREAVKGMDDGTISAGGYKEAMNSLNASDRKYIENMDAKEAAKKTEGASYKKSALGVKENNIARLQLVRTYKLQQVAAAKQSMANAVEAGSQQGLRAGFKALVVSVHELNAAKMVGVTSAISLRAAWAMLQTGALATAGAVKVLGASLMAALGWISLIASVGFMIYELFKDKLFPVSETEEKAGKIIESLKSVEGVATSFQKTMDTVEDPASVAIAGYTALLGVMQDLKTNLLDVTRTAESAIARQNKAFDDLQREKQKIVEESEKKITEIEETHWLMRTTRQKIALREARSARNEANNDIVKAEKEKNEKIEKENADRKDGLLKILDQTTAGIRSSEGFGAFSKIQLAGIDALKEKIQNLKPGEALSVDEIKTAMDSMITPVGTIVETFKGARDAASEFNKEVNKLNQKQQTPFDNAITAAEGLGQKFLELEKGYAGMTDKDNISDELKEQRQELIKALKKQMGTDKAIGEEAINKYIKSLKDARQAIIDNREEVKRLQSAQKASARFTKEIGGVAAMRNQLDIQQKLRDAKMNGIQAEIDANIKLRGNLTKEHRKEIEAIEDKAERTNKLESFDKQRKKVLEDINGLGIKMTESIQQNQVEQAKELYELEMARIDMAKRLLDVRGQMLAVQKTELNNQMKLSEMEMQLENAKNRARSRTEGIDLRPAQQLRQFQKFAAQRMQIALAEYNMTVAKVQIERALLTAKTKLIEAELRALKEKTEDKKEKDNLQAIIDSVATIPDAMSQVFDAQVASAQTTLDMANKSLDIEREKLRLANLTSITGGSAKGAVNQKGMLNFANEMRDTMDMAMESGKQSWRDKQIQDTKDFEIEYGITLSDQDWADFEEALTERMGTMSLGEAFENLNLAEQLDFALTPLSNMFTMLSEMGGEHSNLFAALGSSMTNITGAMNVFNETGALDNMNTLFSEGFKNIDMGTLEGAGTAITGIAAGVGAVAQGLASVYQIKAAQTADRIAQIDKEIAATKRLYGGTKKGEKMVAELEKKKEAAKKKQFQQNKKAMIAQAIAGTALGIVGALGSQPWTPFNFVMAGIVAAIGAYQLAVISSMSYQGGGSAGGGPAVPQSVSMGERKNKVDTRGGNVAGELAYMRGERGVGTGASNFTPAFTGYRHRATGGAAYVVGEQGPELFVPEVPGQIVANDEIAEGGAAITANFTINTIDASTMEQTLNTQRGNIINMIREAANNSGEPFLESVDTLGLQTQGGTT